LSTLTKVLIVLLSVFSLFLCGTVATYVGSSENFRKKATDGEQQLKAARETRRRAEQDLEDGTKAAKIEKDKLDAQIIALTAQATKLQGDLDIAARMNLELQQKVAGMADIMANANSTTKQQTTLFEGERQKVQALEGDRINREKELAETSQSLLEKVTIIAQLENKVRQLTQENQELGTRVDQYLVQYGKIASRPPTTVAAGTPTARPVQPIATVAAQTQSIALNGQVTAVDVRSHLVEISIGVAAGVQKDMVFHVTRGDQYVADIQIVEVWPDRAVGVLNLVKPGIQPQASDKVATNL
jgi:hypothetical protein